MNISALLATVRFEGRRSLRPLRLILWAGLAFFPAALTALILYLEDKAGSPSAFFMTTESVSRFLFVLIPTVTCLLGSLLWATPMIQTELESRTWLYVAIRPHGQTSILLGKYGIAVAWTATAGWISLGLILAMVQPEEGLRILWVMGGLIFLSSVVYGALFGFFGTLLIRRGMVVAIVYAIVFEFLASFVPAVINRITFSYRLRELRGAFLWDRTSTEEPKVLTGAEPVWVHLAVLIVVPVVLIIASRFILSQRELITEEG